MGFIGFIVFWFYRGSLPYHQPIGLILRFVIKEIKGRAVGCLSVPPIIPAIAHIQIESLANAHLKEGIDKVLEEQRRAAAHII